MKYYVELNKKNYEIDVEETNGDMNVRLNGRPIKVDRKSIRGDTHLSYIIDNQHYGVYVRSDSQGVYVNLSHREFPVQVTDELTHRLVKMGIKTHKADRPKTIKASMPGLIVKVLVKEGDTVQENDSLLIIEAMKMENEIRAHQGGQVKKVHITEQQPVEYGADLITLA